MKKKLLFTAYSMGLGGIESALLNLFKRLDYNKYEVTLILERKEGIFLDQIPREVNVYEYRIDDSKNKLIRKIKNRLKLIKWKIKLKNKYDFSCSFATYSIPGGHLALAASKNSNLWVHLNYWVTYNYNKKELNIFFNNIMAKKYNRIVFVSDENRKDVCEHYEGIANKAVVCNNFINAEEINIKLKENCDFKRNNNTLFVNVGRHDEKQKKLTRLINASKRLKNDGYKFQVLLVGDGNDHQMYMDMVKKEKLGDYIIFTGKKSNPFPYYKLADAIVLSSEYEGFPVVFLEAMLLGKPILSTKVSDYEELDNVYGMFCDKDEDSIYNMLKKY